MNSITKSEQAGLEDFFSQNTDLLFQLAKSFTKNIVEIRTEAEALDTISLHTTTAKELLNKRLITKERLFRYLHAKRVAVTADYTKNLLIEKVLEFWSSKVVRETKEPPAEPTKQAEDYPIHTLARKFSEWFFQKLNDGSLQPVDMWNDCRLDLRITANDGEDEQHHTTSHIVTTALQALRTQFGFYFRPNLCHDGVQGRMDVHGLVLVLSCGTLHTTDSCVGVFDAIFGLMRDPFAEDNWKMKTIRFMLKSQSWEARPQLAGSSEMQAVMGLPAPEGSLE